jgi:hypothetical protein
MKTIHDYEPGDLLISSSGNRFLLVLPVRNPGPVYLWAYINDETQARLMGSLHVVADLIKNGKWKYFPIISSENR